MFAFGPLKFIVIFIIAQDTVYVLLNVHLYLKTLCYLLCFVDVAFVNITQIFTSSLLHQLLMCCCVLSHFSRVQLCSLDCSPLGSPVPGVLQTGILEWVARDLLKIFLIIYFSLVSMILASYILKLIIRYIHV